MTPQLICYVAASEDGFIAGPDDALDGLPVPKAQKACGYTAFSQRSR